MDKLGQAADNLGGAEGRFALGAVKCIVVARIFVVGEVYRGRLAVNYICNMVGYQLALVLLDNFGGGAAGGD